MAQKAWTALARLRVNLRYRKPSAAAEALLSWHCKGRIALEIGQRDPEYSREEEARFRVSDDGAVDACGDGAK